MQYRRCILRHRLAFANLFNRQAANAYTQMATAELLVSAGKIPASAVDDLKCALDVEHLEERATQADLGVAELLGIAHAAPPPRLMSMS